ncbi:MAG: aminotransferase class I/II-fold pyridoxal phosphate-dependent enzyme, partial [Pseudomonadales bacterium]|nr:aminotransferase class I/II-fold pyridoxal phosphate-dependent enzyme [Pseudomonadales bacterium]
LIINPNNPTGLMIPVNTIISWAKTLQARGGMLIIDEAFVEIHPEQSILNGEQALPSNLLILRSVGKFFGLAGIRIGFACAKQELLNDLEERLGPWCINGIAQQISIEALSDTRWHEEERRRIVEDNDNTLHLFDPLLQRYQGFLCAHQGLFSSWRLSLAQGVGLYELLAERGVLVRLIPYSSAQCLIRIGNLASENTLLTSDVAKRLNTIP